MEEVFKKILSFAVYAPSGDNMQPWKFVIEQEALYIYNCPEKDPTLYNYKQRAALISHGALMENINIAASSYGFSASFDYFPDSTNPNLTAKVTLQGVPKTGLPTACVYKKTPHKQETIQTHCLNRKTKKRTYKDIPKFQTSFTQPD